MGESEVWGAGVGDSDAGSEQPAHLRRLALVHSLLSAGLDNASAVGRLLTETRAAVDELVRGGEGLPGNELERLRREAGQLRDALASLLVIERARGMLMQEHKISDTDALSRLEQEARRRHQQLRDIAAEMTEAAPRSAGEAPTPPTARSAHGDGDAGRADGALPGKDTQTWRHLPPT